MDRPTSGWARGSGGGALASSGMASAAVGGPGREGPRGQGRGRSCMWPLLWEAWLPVGVWGRQPPGPWAAALTAPWGGSFGRPRVGVLPGARSPSPWRVQCRALGRPGGGGLPGRASHPRRVERFAQVAARGPGQSGEVGGQGRLSAGSAWEAARGGCPGPAAGGWMASGDGRPGLGQRWRCPGPDGDGGL